MKSLSAWSLAACLAPMAWMGFPAGAAVPTDAAGTELELWYRQPAQKWLEALPVGNGRVGAMVFGGAARERIALNEVTLWSGGPGDQHENPEARAAFQAVRELMLVGKGGEAGPFIGKMLGREGNYGSNLPGGDLLLAQGVAEGAPADYRRSLDLDQAVARTEFAAGGIRYKREVFVSNPDGVLVVRLTADRKGSIGFTLGYDGGKLPCEAKAAGKDTLTVTGRAFGPHSDGKTGVAFQITFRVLADGGTVSAEGKEIQVAGADAATVLVAFNTDFQGRDPGSLCSGQISKATEKQYSVLRDAHVADHRKLFRRVALDLGGLAATREPTDARLAGLRAGKADPQLAALFFQYGRYLMIAGSREDSPLPMHLQGIWNDNLACNMGWTCDYHLDINTQQNYWPAETCNLSECASPLFRLVESLVEPGRRTARIEYGIDRGWVCHVFTNAWGFTAPGWGGGWGLHVVGGTWIATHLWEHYLFTGDKEFLAKRAYPVLKGSAEFFLEYLFEDPASGYLLTGPSVSPEMGGETNPGATHDRAMIYELFSACLDAGSALGVDADFRSRLEAARAKLPPYRIGRNGQLQEWLQDDGGETNHRHTSHLTGLFPLSQIDPVKTPDLAKAADKSLDLRMGRPDWEDVEWSRANAICYYARLRDGARAEGSVSELLRKLTRTNLLTVSVGGIAGAEQDIFVIDGNTAATAGIAEMLLQSQNGEILLLPALPKAWATGSVKGLRARGGFEADLAWQDGKLTEATIRSLNGGPCKIRSGGKAIAFPTRSGEAYRFDGQLEKAGK